MWFIGRSEIHQGTEASFKSINGHHHMEDHVEIGHLTKYDVFRINRDLVMDLEIWFKIERACSASSSMISDQNCTTRSSITTLLDPF